MNQFNEVVKSIKAQNNQSKYKGSLCWDCKNVFFNKCQKPVEGWKAERNDICYPIRLLDKKTGLFRTIIQETESYFVFECPNFVPDD